MAVSITIAQTAEEREACYAIRIAVFVQEQAVPLDLEMDEYDHAATHFLLREDGLPQATARLVSRYGRAKIGRVAVRREARGRGLGRALMEAVLDEARRQGFPEAILDSQTYALPFYERLGFAAEGGEFEEAGLTHFSMRRRLQGEEKIRPGQS